MDDGISDEDLLALAAATAPRATQPGIASSTPAAPPPPHTSFAAAFAGVTNSSLYTSVANMPSPAAPANRPPLPVAPPPPFAVAPVPKPLSAHAVLVSPRQRGNPVLHHISNVAYEFGPKEMSADYVCGDTCCALYLSLKYHLLHNNYLAARLQGVGTAFTLRVLLLLVDVDDSERPLLELTQLTFAYGWTLVCCWSVEEVARYLETLRAYEKKTAQAIAERVDDSDHAAKLTEALTEIRSINKTDVRNLAAAFGSFAGIAQATPDDLSQTMGMGERKVRRLHHVMTQPFITSQMARRTDAAGGTAITTPAQAAAAHAAAMEKAKAQAAQPAKRSAIVFFNQLPTANAPAAPAAASNPLVSASPPAATSSSLPPPSAAATVSPAMPAATRAVIDATAATAQPAAAAAARPTVGTRAPSTAAASPPSVPLEAEFDLSGFAS